MPARIGYGPGGRKAAACLPTFGSIQYRSLKHGGMFAALRFTRPCINGDWKRESSLLQTASRAWRPEVRSNSVDRMRIESIGILGGTGFVGSHLANELIDIGSRVRIFTRSRERARHLWLLPNTEIIETDVYNATNVAKQIAGCDAVINLAGILNEKGDNGACD